MPSSSPGTRRQLDFIHYGIAGQGPKAYLQAALHADEIPGLLVLHKLIPMLDAADARGAITGNIVLAPIANPIGSSQHLFGELAGRYDQESGGNFNRGYPDLAHQIAEEIGSQLGDDAEQNTRLIRGAAVKILSERSVPDEVGALKNTLVLHAIDADIALDLHCDFESIMHLYTGTPLWDEARDLAAYLGAKVTLLATVSGGNPFDEALSGLWWQLSELLPGRPIPNACMAATIELRGKADVEEQQAESDARALYYYLQSRGVISGKLPEPPALPGEATPLSGVEKVRAPFAGVVSSERSPGDHIMPGDVLCSLCVIRQYDAE